MQCHRQSEFLHEFDVSRSNPTPARRVTPPWNVYMAKFFPGSEGYPVWQTGLPALAGHPTYHVNVIKLKWEIICTGGLPHISGLPHLPGVPHLHINRFLFSQFRPRDVLQPRSQGFSHWNWEGRVWVSRPSQFQWEKPWERGWIFSRQLPMHTYVRGCMCIRRHLKETVLRGTITWSEREKKHTN